MQNNQNKKSINDKELEILKFWQDNKIFEKSLTPSSPPPAASAIALASAGGEDEPESKLVEETTSETRNDFTFYDGPPFATGLPHIGHILAGTIKDAIPRYHTMKGERVRRVWGWDCHGLPIENMIEKELGLNSKKEIEEYGVDKFNQAAADSVLRYEKEWKQIVPRLGRWVDMEHAYKTMDATYTESVWWSFQTLYDKGLAHEGHKIMHICPRCETPLAQSEVGLEYHDVTDMTVTVEFKLKNKKYNDNPLYLLAWTTTPWTLPGNTALAVNKELDYVIVESKFENETNYFIVAKKLVEKVFAKSEGYKIVEEINIADYIGESYEPVFQTFDNEKFLNKLENSENIWKVWHADFITDDAGTGIAHEAPAFGAEDMELAKANNIPIIKHVLMNGEFVSEVVENFSLNNKEELENKKKEETLKEENIEIKNDVNVLDGVKVKQKDDTMSADILIVKWLAHNNKLFSKEKIVHSYPLCWRCKTPLLNYATSSWFVDVPAIKDKLISENSKVKWIPEHIRDGRFGKWLEGAREWAVSRRRYWGAPLPIWQSASGKIKVIGSLAELAELNANKSKNKYIVMRHGEAKSNKENYYDEGGDVNNNLTEQGIEQVKVSALNLVKEKIDIIIYSPILRTTETKNILQEVLNVKETLEINGLRESIENNSLDVRHEVQIRMQNVINDLEKKYEGKKILIVTHQGPARGLFKQNGMALVNLDLAEYKYLPNGVLPRDDTGAINLHRPYIDEVKLKIDGEEYTRIPDVFDCWYESGSMPYAQLHYPFENVETFKNNFPADFIAEGMDQTRGWFYSLINLAVGLGFEKEETINTQEKAQERKDTQKNVLENNKNISDSDDKKYTEMFGVSPYKHVIVNGVVMAGDGKKMSKSEKNYTDPMILVEKYGADALRFALANSPVMQGENVLFSDTAVDEAYKKNILKLENILNMYLLNPYNEGRDIINSDNNLDIYILAKLKQVINQVTIAYDNYKLDDATRPIETFIDTLSVEYVKGSRDRLKGVDGDKEERQSTMTLQYVLLELSKLMAPMAPFIAERIYKEVNGEMEANRKIESVHLDSWPISCELSQDELNIIVKITKTFDCVSLILNERNKVKIPVRQPLAMVKLSGINNENDIDMELIKEMTNIKSIDLEIADTVNANANNINEQSESDKKLESINKNISVWLDTNITAELKREGDQRELSRAIKDMRRELGLISSDNIMLTIDEQRSVLLDDEYKKTMKIVEVKIEAGQNVLLIEKA